jgi:hypothetical protein
MHCQNMRTINRNMLNEAVSLSLYLKIRMELEEKETHNYIRAL